MNTSCNFAEALLSSTIIKQEDVMKYLRTAVLCCCCLLAAVQVGRAQEDLAKRLGKLAAANAVKYVSPIISGWGADLNSGFYHTADLHDILGFDVQLKISATQLSDEDKKYQFEMPDQITYGALTLRAGTDYEKFVTANSVVGAKDETIIRTKTGSIVPNQEIARLPGGFDVNFPVVGTASPLVVPQAAIGLPFGIEVIGRFIPTTTISGDGVDIGKVNFFGFGVRHDIDQYIPVPLPVNIAVHFMTQKFNFKDANDNNLISATATAYGVEASAKAFIFTLYGGFQLESSSFEIGPYTANVNFGGQPQQLKDIKFTIDGKNTSRAHVGLRLILLLVNVHADYSFATAPVFTVGAGITLR